MIAAEVGAAGFALAGAVCLFLSVRLARKAQPQKGPRHRA